MIDIKILLYTSYAIVVYSGKIFHSIHKAEMICTPSNWGALFVILKMMI